MESTMSYLREIITTQMVDDARLFKVLCEEL